MANYFVDFTGGDEGNSGLSALLPVKYFVGMPSSTSGITLAAGDRMDGNRGEIWRETLTVPSSGSAGNPITFGAYGTGADPIFDGSDLISTWTAHAGGTTPTGADGFEVGDADLSGGDGAYWGGGAASGATIVGNDTTHVVSGTYSAKVTWASLGASATAQAYHGISQGDASFSQFMLNVTSIAQTGASISLGGFNYSSTSRCNLVAVYASVTTYTLNLYIQTDGSSTTLTGSTALTMGRWYTVEFEYLVHATVGGGQYWIDGVSEGSSFVLDTSFANSQPNRQYIGVSACNTAGRVGATIYFDNAKYHTAYMGPFYANIWQASVTTEPLQIFQDGVRPTKGTSIVSLHPGEWFWAADVLYLYSIADPDTYSSPGIEASARDYCILTNGESYLTIQSINTQKSNSINVSTAGGNASNIILNGVTAGYGYSAGISSSGSATTTAVTIQNCTANWNGGSGIQITTPSHDWSILNNTVHNNSQVYNGTGDTALYYTAGIKGWSGDASVPNVLIQGNTVYNNGILPTSAMTSNPVGGKGIWLDTFVDTAYATGPVITKNIVYGNNADNILIENSQYNTVSYNLVYSSTTNNGFGIRATDWHHLSAANYNKIYNNVSYANVFGIEIAGDKDTSTANRCIGNLIKNNILYGNTSNQLVARYGGENDGTMGIGNVYANNLIGAEAAQFIVWAQGAYKTTIAAFNAVADDTEGGGSNITGDPLFVNAAGGDFRLQSGSPCINSGVDVGLVTDIVGKPIPCAGSGDAGTAPDIGAYEYGDFKLMLNYKATVL